ncbi:MULTISPECIES: PPOX class F420-dependent oxidoreductase [Halorussus]|uniref:PPOX class F420-dependent oxidoreductase n=1 Tax=Halorussus TaxID=1070314 RepID=UPI000E21B2AC|nr:MULTISPECIES: PPOX class F420-dependent oxidoreductase [Halorussus]NHN57884.1 PPOX class F420-dependent oxidoreductase [Halorussus sp. JP-T4]
MESIPESFTDLFERETFANFATLMGDGTPQVTPVWIDRDEEGHLLVNTARGRQKERNVERDPKVGLCVMDPDEPYRYVSVRGEVVEVTEDGAVEHIDDLARRYMDVEEYPNKDEESGSRVIVRIRPDRVVTGGE